MSLTSAPQRSTTDRSTMDRSTTDRPLTPPGPWIAAARDHSDLYLRPFSRWLHRSFRSFGRFTRFCTLNIEIINPDAPNRAGGFLLASTHLSHLEPFIVSVICDREIDWVTRIEFFGTRLLARFLQRVGGIAVNRFGVPVSAIRKSIARAKAGRVIGICPEGGVCIGEKSACRGAPIKRGVCLIAQRAGVPVLPCVIVGSHRLNHVGPWIPFRHGKLWIAFGEPIQPPPADAERKAARKAMAMEIEQQFASLYRQILERYGISDEWVP